MDHINNKTQKSKTVKQVIKPQPILKKNTSQKPSNKSIKISEENNKFFDDNPKLSEEEVKDLFISRVSYNENGKKDEARFKKFQDGKLKTTEIKSKTQSNRILPNIPTPGKIEQKTYISHLKLKRKELEVFQEKTHTDADIIEFSNQGLKLIKETLNKCSEEKMIENSEILSINPQIINKIKENKTDLQNITIADFEKESHENNVYSHLRVFFKDNNIKVKNNRRRKQMIALSKLIQHQGCSE